MKPALTALLFAAGLAALAALWQFRSEPEQCSSALPWFRAGQCEGR